MYDVFFLDELQYLRSTFNNPNIPKPFSHFTSFTNANMDDRAVLCYLIGVLELKCCIH